ncbi:Uncharacterized conserved protein, contains ParB-like and HNH nuclease domains [Bacteroidales bacterium WCE2008]|nr:Uncharacterized conserved protein, contains ParB-like and HNH nuclease domains [Bacteroidales bacterium WCE2008]
MNNSIQLISIAELLDGRTFFIPSYQRGYRWTTKEVTDLLSDLYSFTIGSKKKEGEFYCLQPIIVQRIEDDLLKAQILKGIESSSQDVWEVIDGQQRLTSVYILYKYLLEQKGWTNEKLKKARDGKELFHLRYETRPGSSSFLEALSAERLDDSNVDFSHISDAYRIIESWLENEAKVISDRYHRSRAEDDICDALFKLLNCGRELKEDSGSAQFIWYELASDGGEKSKQKAISEFLKINTGKIELTDAELIKALFLQRRNFLKEERESKQLEIAMQWESIENTLHKDDFWYFISSKKSRPNRIDEIFELIFKTEDLKEYHEDLVDKSLTHRNAFLSEKNSIFRYYYRKFDGLQGEILQDCIKKEWAKVMSVFRTLEDWYEDPKTYNYVGFLSQCNIDIAKLYIKYASLPESATKHEILEFFESQIKRQLEAVKIREGKIVSQYGPDTQAIYKLLLFLNINQMNSELANLQKVRDISFNGSIYKFPFDIFVSQNWNVEHIDSFTTNSLMSAQEQKEWVDNALIAIQEIKDQAGTKIRIDAHYAKGEYKAIIPLIQEIVEEDADEDQKNSIGNLTLLDEKTNKSYGNALFCQKNKIIRDRIQRGTFVPATTRMVFNKDFDSSATRNFFKWGAEEKAAYQQYIFDELKPFLTFDEKDLQLF